MTHLIIPRVVTKLLNSTATTPRVAGSRRG
jgi:hypothetical protein